MNRKPEEFYFAIQRTVRKEAGKALTPRLKSWRYTQSLDDSHIMLKPDSRRFLVRYGLLDAGQEHEALEKEFRALIAQASRASGDAPGVVAGWIELFAAGEYSVLQTGVCAEEPRCGVCGLKESCRYLAAGGKDARAFGRSLASELLLSDGRPADLSVADLLAFVASGEKCGAADIARAGAALKTFQGLRGVFMAKPERLQELGLSDEAVARIQGMGELCRLWAKERTARGEAFKCGQDFYDFFHLRLRELRREVFVVALLDQKNRLIDQHQVSEGTLTETMAHPREVFTQAIGQCAAAVAVIHNHPSGDPKPSEADKTITKRLNDVAKLVGIRFLDHVIVGDGKYFSFLEEGKLD